jgi:hypothetical protein
MTPYELLRDEQDDGFNDEDGKQARCEFSKVRRYERENGNEEVRDDESARMQGSSRGRCSIQGE